MWKKDLIELIVIEKKTAGHEVLVAGDFNDNLNDEQGTIAQMMQELGLRDIPQETNILGPNTHNRGTDILD